MTDESTLKDKSLIKDSYDKLINLYFTENRLNLIDNTNIIKCENFNNFKKNKILKKSQVKKDKSFLNQNFCTDECQIKFQKILTKIKKGEIDINKINWSKENEGFNLIQNLVNFYYNIGYSEGISHLQAENKIN